MAGTTTNGSQPATDAGVPRTDWAEQRRHDEQLQLQRRLDAATEAAAVSARLAEEAAGDADAARATYAAERHSLDPEGKRGGSLTIAAFVACVLAVLDVAPAWWAAQALGGEQLDTWLVTGLLVAGLAGFAALLSHFKHGHVRYRDGRRQRNWSFWAAFAASAALVLIESGLRFDYLRTVMLDTYFGATIEAGLLALVTTALLWMSYVVLLRAEPIVLWKARRERDRLAKVAAARREEAAAAARQLANEKHATAALGNGHAEPHDALNARVHERGRATRSAADGDGPAGVAE
jgi:hypothetical protein